MRATYDVRISNWAGTVTSPTATLTVSAPITWNGSVSTDWHNPTNWTPQQVPTTTDIAIINSGTVVADTNAQFFALHLNGGSLSGSVVVRSNSVMNWNSGTLLASGSLTVETNGALHVQTGSTKYCEGALTNAGTVNWTGGLVYIRNNNGSRKGHVVNQGLWEMHGNLTLEDWHGTGLEIFTNNGLFRKASGTGVGKFNVVLDNLLGTVEVLSGTLRFESGVQLDGLFIAGSGAAMEFSGGTATYTALTQLTGAGQYRLTGGTLEGLLDYLPNLSLQGGSVALSPNYQTNGTIEQLDLDGASLLGHYQVSGSLNWNSGAALTAGNSLTVQSNAVLNLPTSATKYCEGALTNHGTVNWTSGLVYIRNNNGSRKGHVVNLGLWEMNGNLTLDRWYDTGLEVFSNGGVFRKVSGSGIGNFNVVLDNPFGAIEVLSGTLRFQHGGQLDGLFIAGSGAVMEFSGGTTTYTPLTQLTGAGQYRLTGGTLLDLLDYLPNLSLQGGSVGLSPNYQTNGTIKQLDLNGSTLIGSNTVTGVLNLNSGNIGGPTTVISNGLVNWSGGMLLDGGSLTIQSNAVLNLLTTTTKYCDGALTNAGTVNWIAGLVYIRNNNSSRHGHVVNQGLWQMQGNHTLDQWYATGLEIFSNTGTFQKSTGTGTGKFNVVLDNQAGTVEVLSGTLRFNSDVQLDGLFIAGPGAAMEFSGGTTTYTALTQLTGAGQYRLTGGTLEGLLDYLPNLSLQGGSVALSPNYQTNGTIEQLDLDGATLIGSNAVSGVLNVNSGGLAGPTMVAEGGVFNWFAGGLQIGSSLVVQSNGIVNLQGGSQKDLRGAVTNYGQIYWSGGSISVRNNASTEFGAVENQPGGLWEVQGDLSMSDWYSNNNPYFLNRGTLRKTAGSGTATMDVVFQNQGLVEQLSGIWTFGRNFSLTEGTVLFGLAGDTTFGRINLTGTASLGGRLAATLLSGYVPDTNRTFQVMSYGVVSGNFTNTAGLDVGFGRFFTPLYTPTALILETHATNFISIILSAPERELNAFSFFFTGEPGTDYTVQYSENLGQSNWNTLMITNITVSPTKVTDPNGAAAERFYRVVDP